MVFKKKSDLKNKYIREAVLLSRVRNVLLSRNRASVKESNLTEVIGVN